MSKDLILQVVPTDSELPSYQHEQTSKYVEAGLQGATNTSKAYSGCLKRFSAWCTAHGLEQLPTSVETLAGFVTQLAEDGRKLATIKLHCAAVAKAHQLAGLDSPTDDKRLKVVLNGIARLNGMRQHQAPAFSLANFKRTVKAIDVTTLAGRRDRVVLLLGFTGAFRRSELTAVNIEDLSFSEDGLIITIPKSKTNQLGQAEEKAVFYSPDPKLCPVRTLQNWLGALPRTTGPVFVSLGRHGHLTERRLSDQHLNLVVRRYLGPGFTAHSLRASFVTIAKLAGADDSEVMNQTKHKSSEMIRRYTRLDNVKQHNAAQKLGL